MNTKDKRQTRAKYQAYLKRFKAQTLQLEGYIRNRYNRITKAGRDAERQAILLKMTNWQKSQYCQLKVKGHDMDLDTMQTMLTPKREQN